MTSKQKSKNNSQFDYSVSFLLLCFLLFLFKAALTVCLALFAQITLTMTAPLWAPPISTKTDRTEMNFVVREASCASTAALHLERGRQ